MKKYLFGLLLLVVLFLPKVSHAASYIVVGYSRLQCVTYVQAVAHTSVRTADGYARTFPINTHTPRVGEIMVMRSGWTGHVALVIGISGNWIHIKEANYVPGRITTRWIYRYDWHIRGYYRIGQSI